MKPTTIVKQSQLIADFFVAYQQELVNFATIRLGNREESEDVIQDVFVKLMSFDGLINEATIKSFAFTIASNKIKDLLRRRVFRRQVEENTQYEMTLQHSSVERVVEYHETLKLVHEKMNAMSPARAKVYEMSLCQGMSVGEIAEKLNVSKRTVESQLFTSRKQMRIWLSEAM